MQPFCQAIKQSTREREKTPSVPRSKCLDPLRQVFSQHGRCAILARVNWQELGTVESWQSKSAKMQGGRREARN